MRPRYLLAILPLLAGGCAPDLAALASDQNALCVRATWVGGSVEMSRNYGCDRAPVAGQEPAGK